MESLVKHDERLKKNIYSGLGRIEKHLDKLNGKVERHETDIAKMQVWGGIALITFPNNREHNNEDNIMKLSENALV